MATRRPTLGDVRGPQGGPVRLPNDRVNVGRFFRNIRMIPPQRSGGFIGRGLQQFAQGAAAAGGLIAQKGREADFLEQGKEFEEETLAKASQQMEMLGRFEAYYSGDFIDQAINEPLLQSPADEKQPLGAEVFGVGQLRAQASQQALATLARKEQIPVAGNPAARMQASALRGRKAGVAAGDRYAGMLDQMFTYNRELGTSSVSPDVILAQIIKEDKERFPWMNDDTQARAAYLSELQEASRKVRLKGREKFNKTFQDELIQATTDQGIAQTVAGLRTEEGLQQDMDTRVANARSSLEGMIRDLYSEIGIKDARTVALRKIFPAILRAVHQDAEEDGHEVFIERQMSAVMDMLGDTRLGNQKASDAEEDWRTIEELSEELQGRSRRSRSTKTDKTFVGEFAAPFMADMNEAFRAKGRLSAEYTSAKLAEAQEEFSAKAKENGWDVQRTETERNKLTDLLMSGIARGEKQDSLEERGIAEALAKKILLGDDDAMSETVDAFERDLIGSKSFAELGKRFTANQEAAWARGPGTSWALASEKFDSLLSRVSALKLPGERAEDFRQRIQSARSKFNEFAVGHATQNPGDLESVNAAIPGIEAQALAPIAAEVLAEENEASEEEGRLNEQVLRRERMTAEQKSDLIARRGPGFASKIIGINQRATDPNLIYKADLNGHAKNIQSIKASLAPRFEKMRAELGEDSSLPKRMEKQVNDWLPRIYTSGAKTIFEGMVLRPGGFSSTDEVQIMSQHTEMVGKHAAEYLDSLMKSHGYETVEREVFGVFGSIGTKTQDADYDYWIGTIDKTKKLLPLLGDDFREAYQQRLSGRHVDLTAQAAAAHERIRTEKGMSLATKKELVFKLDGLTGQHKWSDLVRVAKKHGAENLPPFHMFSVFESDKQMKQALENTEDVMLMKDAMGLPHLAPGDYLEDRAIKSFMRTQNMLMRTRPYMTKGGSPK